ncbi:hypothetical protein RchiOBHm_Chr1g0321941 [Rosa chinensis]|uniref:Transmembrane protein n=1 Tax=Rosa chinensis TaxID=74649 RepID=A0A2P6S964_ROSCH|nr:hypothetical protein RchiOBHm_Chr1g0321941 [Rosa chinensis]
MGFVNNVKKLQRREISSKRDRAITMSDARERFYNIHLQALLRICIWSFFCVILIPILGKHVV